MCKSVETTQIPPEGFPKMSLKKQSENSLTFQVTRPDNAYTYPDEELAYNFEIISKCRYEDPMCQQMYNAQSKVKHVTSAQPSFELTFDKLSPYWKHQFSCQVKNSTFIQ